MSECHRKETNETFENRQTAICICERERNFSWTARASQVMHEFPMHCHETCYTSQHWFVLSSLWWVYPKILRSILKMCHISKNDRRCLPATCKNGTNGLNFCTEALEVQSLTPSPPGTASRDHCTQMDDVQLHAPDLCESQQFEHVPRSLGSETQLVSST